MAYHRKDEACASGPGADALQGERAASGHRRFEPGLIISGIMLLLLSSTIAVAQTCEPFKVLVFSKTAGFRHGPQIIAGAALIQSLGSMHGFAVDHSEDAALFTSSNLAQYAVVIFLNTTGDILTSTQEAAFESFILSGGGFVGIHSASDTEFGWPFYGALIGAYFQNHPAIQLADLMVVDPNHPSTAPLPATFSHTDEWYNFQTNVATNPLINVLMTVNEATYVGGTMGQVHPIAWSREIAGSGRSWYTALGHTVATYAAPFFRDHLLGGILWAAGSMRSLTICGTQSYGSGSGLPVLSLMGAPLSVMTGRLMVSGGGVGASGLLGVSTCAAQAISGSHTILIDLSPPRLVVTIPLTFNAAGQWEALIPLGLQLPGSFGLTLFVQAAQIAPPLGLSNGLELRLCP